MLVDGRMTYAFFVASEADVIAAYVRWIPIGVSAVLEHTALWAVALALPAAFLFGLLRERLAFSSVGELLTKLEHTPAERLGPILREVLRDPELQVIFPTPLGLVDAAGAPVRPAQSLGVTPLGDP